MVTRFVIHRHKAGKPHFDLRLYCQDRVRSWSMLRIPPMRTGEQRLAIERESLSQDEVRQPVIDESAFGAGRVYAWDEGEAELELESPPRLILRLRGDKLSGKYELRHMSWYPGNRWLLKKTG